MGRPAAPGGVPHRSGRQVAPQVGTARIRRLGDLSLAGGVPRSRDAGEGGAAAHARSRRRRGGRPGPGVPAQAAERSAVLSALPVQVAAPHLGSGGAVRARLRGRRDSTAPDLRGPPRGPSRSGTRGGDGAGRHARLPRSRAGVAAGRRAQAAQPPAHGQGLLPRAAQRRRERRPGARLPGRTGARARHAGDLHLGQRLLPRRARALRQAVDVRAVDPRAVGHSLSGAHRGGARRPLAHGAQRRRDAHRPAARGRAGAAPPPGAQHGADPRRRRCAVARRLPLRVLRVPGRSLRAQEPWHPDAAMEADRVLRTAAGVGSSTTCRTTPTKPPTSPTTRARPRSWAP